MHHPANSITELCHGWERDNACGECIPMYYSSGEEAILVVGSSRYLSVCQRMDEFRLSGIATMSCFAICNLIHHD